MIKSKIATVHIMCAIIMIFAGAITHSASPSAENTFKANATRCLKVAKNYLNIADYENANNYAKLGLSYDSEVSDLYYIACAAQTKLGIARGKILPLIEKAITLNKWVDYNFDGARTLYASILCDTNNESEALKVLSSKPFIYSNDAEYIRTKSSYKLFTKNSIEQARDKINAARKIYIDDERFPLLFFKYEYMLNTNSTLATVAKSLDASSNKTRDTIAKYFIEKVQDGTLKNIDIQIYSTLFTKEQEEKQRMLKSFVAAGNSHPLYSIAAIESGLMNSQEAWGYFSSLKDIPITQGLLYNLLPLIKGAGVKKSIKDFLSSFNGNYLIDTDNDGEIEVAIKYKSGRPESFTYDKNNDGLFEYTGHCNIGDITDITIPVAPAIANKNQVNSDSFLNTNINDDATYTAVISYNKFPRVDGALYTVPYHNNTTQNDNVGDTLAIKFTIPHDIFVFEPCQTATDTYIKKTTGVDFYTITPKSHKAITENTLLNVASFYEVPCAEDIGATAKFTVLDGVIQNAEYKRQDGAVYSKLQFENGIPKTRIIDMNKDGHFEAIKEYGIIGSDIVSPESTLQDVTKIALYGIPSLKNDEIFLRSISLDSDGDTNIDYSEEYLSYGERISQWNDSKTKGFTLRYHKYPQKKESDDLVEEAQFYSNDKSLVTITTINGNCAKVTKGSKVYKVIKGKSPTFYWVETPGSPTEEVYVTEHFNHLNDEPIAEGVCVIIENNTDSRVIVVKVAGTIYAHIIGYSDALDSDKNTSDNTTN